MNIIPVNVQITSIENTIDKHIVINAQTTNYQYLAYFFTLGGDWHPIRQSLIIAD